MTRHASGDGDSRPQTSGDAVVAHEEEAVVRREWRDLELGAARRVTEEHDVHEQHPRRVEELAQERVEAAASDSGEIEILPDGSVSIPVFEEQLVITRRIVLTERVIIRKALITEWQSVEARLRRERVETDYDE